MGFLYVASSAPMPFAMLHNEQTYKDLLVVTWIQQMSSEVMEPKTHMGHAIV